MWIFVDGYESAQDDCLTSFRVSVTIKLTASSQDGQIRRTEREFNLPITLPGSSSSQFCHVAGSAMLGDAPCKSLQRGTVPFHVNACLTTTEKEMNLHHRE